MIIIEESFEYISDVELQIGIDNYYQSNQIFIKTYKQHIQSLLLKIFANYA